VSRDRADEAFRISVELMMDLLVGTRAYGVFHRSEIVKGMRPEMHIGFVRMCVFHIALGLAKCVEFYDRYKSVIPDEVRPTFRELVKDIRARGVVDFRNQIAGHIWDLTAGRPLASGEAQERLSDMLREQEVAGSNTVAPTMLIPRVSRARPVRRGLRAPARGQSTVAGATR
jgi:hypothetical protein